MPEMSVVTRTYTSSFAIDRAKLSRIATIFEYRFAQTNKEYRITYKTKSAKGKRLEVGALDELLGLDNPVRNPIVSLEIEATTKGGPEDVVSSIQYDSDDSDNISLRVASHDVKWSTQLFGEIEEQLERTFLSGLIYKLKSSTAKRLLLPLVAMLITIIAALSMTLIAPDKSKKLDLQAFVDRSRFLSPEDIQMLQKQSENLHTVEEKVDFLLEVERRKLTQMAMPLAKKEAHSASIRALLTWRTLFVALPMLIIAVCLVYLLVYCYPHAVFAWGDCEEHNNRILAKRRALWTVVIASLLIGVVAGLFTFSITELLKPSV